MTLVVVVALTKKLVTPVVVGVATQVGFAEKPPKVAVQVPVVPEHVAVLVLLPPKQSSKAAVPFRQSLSAPSPTIAAEICCCDEFAPVGPVRDHITLMPFAGGAVVLTKFCALKFAGVSPLTTM